MSKIAEIVYEKIKSGEYASGINLPETAALAKDFGVSVEEVEKAMSALVYEGVLERQYVKEIKCMRVSKAGELGVLGGILSLTKEAIKRGMTPGSKVLDYGILPAGMFLGDKLGISPDEKVIIVERLRTVDGTPVAIETSNIPLKYMPDVSESMFEATGADASTFDLMDKSGIHLAKAADIVSAVKLEKREAELLDMEEGEPILQRERWTWDDQGRLAKWSRAFFKAKSRYEMNLR